MEQEALMSIAQNLAEQERKAAGGQSSAPKQKKKPAKKAKLAESPPKAEPPPKSGATFAQAGPMRF